jgi:hypothetical protein
MFDILISSLANTVKMLNLSNETGAKMSRHAVFGLVIVINPLGPS